MAARTLHLTGDKAADRLLGSDPLALLIGMVLDQQIPMERAFIAPYLLQERLGGPLDAASIAAMDPDDLAGVFSAKPALHRFPSSMAARVQEVCRIIVEKYDSTASRVWTDATDAKALLKNVKALPGFGEQKAKIFIALLGKQLGLRVPGWAAVSAPFGAADSFLSVADIDSPASLAKVRQHKQEMKAAAKARAVTHP